MQSHRQEQLQIYRGCGGALLRRDDQVQRSQHGREVDLQAVIADPHQTATPPDANLDHLQCPTVFGVRGLTARPLWRWPATEDVFTNSVETVLLLSDEFHQHRERLQHESIRSEVRRGRWDAWHVMEEGRWVLSREELGTHFPTLQRVLSELPVHETSLGYVYFSRLSAGSEIGRHHGPTNTKLRLQVVLHDEQTVRRWREGGDGKAADAASETVSSVLNRVSLGRLWVGGEEVEYEAGRVLIMDDSYLHGVVVDGTRDRVVLLIDLWHPELAGAEQVESRRAMEEVFGSASAGATQPSQTDSVGTVAPTAELISSAAYDASTLGTEVVVADAVMSPSDSVSFTLQPASQQVSSSGELSWLVQSAAASAASAIVTVEATAIMDGSAVAPSAVVVEDASSRLSTGGMEQASVAAAFPMSTPQVSDKGLKGIDGRGRIVRAQDVFVTAPGDGSQFSNHRLSPLYAKMLADMQSARITNKIGTFPQALLRKTMVIGDAGVGKTSFLLRAADDVFTSEYIPTIGVDFKIINWGYSGDAFPPSFEEPIPLKTQVWDVAGPERFRAITTSYYRGAHGIFLCYNVTDRESFRHITRWHHDATTHHTGDLVFVLLGLQADASLDDASMRKQQDVEDEETDDERKRRTAMGIPRPRRRRREVSYAEGLELATSLGFPFLECSARDDRHVLDALATMIHHLVLRAVDTRMWPLSDQGRPLREPPVRRCIVS